MTQNVDFEVELSVDGKNIPLNEFVQTFIGNTVGGMLRALRDIDFNWEKVEVTVKRAQLR